MSTNEHSPDLEALLAHAGWLEELARRLVGPGAAADLVQDTYVAALEAAPDGDRSLRPWLATVLSPGESFAAQYVFRNPPDRPGPRPWSSSNAVLVTVQP